MLKPGPFVGAETHKLTSETTGSTPPYDSLGHLDGRVVVRGMNPQLKNCSGLDLDETEHAAASNGKIIEGALP
jgi:hypothetical protein